MRRAQISFLCGTIIWAVVILACAAVLRETEHLSKLLLILGGGTAAYVVILGGALRRAR